jgi:hypothetical protein
VASDLRGLGGWSSGERSSTASVFRKGIGATLHPSGGGRPCSTETTWDVRGRRERQASGNVRGPGPGFAAWPAVGGLERFGVNSAKGPIAVG